MKIFEFCFLKKIMKKQPSAGEVTEPGSCPGYFHHCRAEELGSHVDFAECLSIEGGWCPYRTAIASGYYCKHPDWKEIVEQTGMEAT